MDWSLGNFHSIPSKWTIISFVGGFVKQGVGETDRLRISGAESLWATVDLGPQVELSFSKKLVQIYSQLYGKRRGLRVPSREAGRQLDCQSLLPARSANREDKLSGSAAPRRTCWSLGLLGINIQNDNVVAINHNYFKIQ